MTKKPFNIKAVCLAAALVSVNSVHLALAHPGDHDTPDISGHSGGCSRCGDTSNDDTSDSNQDGASERESNYDEPQTRTASLSVDADALLDKVQVTQRKVADIGARLSLTQEAFEQTGKLSASLRRKVIRSMRSARRANQRLARDLGSFIEQHSDALSKGLQTQLQTYLAALNAYSAYLSDQAARLGNTGNCSSNQCAEVIETLYRQDDSPVKSFKVNGLSSTLSAIVATSGGS